MQANNILSLFIFTILLLLLLLITACGPTNVPTFSNPPQVEPSPSPSNEVVDDVNRGCSNVALVKRSYKRCQLFEVYRIVDNLSIRCHHHWVCRSKDHGH